MWRACDAVIHVYKVSKVSCLQFNTNLISGTQTNFFHESCAGLWTSISVYTTMYSVYAPGKFLKTNIHHGVSRAMRTSIRKTEHGVPNLEVTFRTSGDRLYRA